MLSNWLSETKPSPCCRREWHGCEFEIPSQKYATEKLCVLIFLHQWERQHKMTLGGMPYLKNWHRRAIQPDIPSIGTTQQILDSEFFVSRHDRGEKWDFLIFGKHPKNHWSSRQGRETEWERHIHTQPRHANRRGIPAWRRGSNSLCC